MISFQLTAEELALARRAAIPKVWRFNLLFGAAFFLLIGRGLQLDRSFGIALLTAIAGWYLFARAGLWWQAKRLFQSEPTLKHATTVSWSSDGIVLDSSWARFAVKWDGLYGWRERDGLLMLYISSADFLILPRRAFLEEAEQADLKRQLEQHKIPRL